MPAYTLSVSSAGAALTWGDIALVFSGSGGPGASVSTTGSGTAAVAVTTTADHSAVAVIALDWIPADGSSRVWLTVNGYTPSASNGYELEYFNNGDYGVYAAYWPDAGTAGTKTVGLSAPAGMKYTIIATEVLGVAGPAPDGAALPVGFRVAARPAWTDAGARLAAGVSVSATGVGYALQSSDLPVGLSLTAGYDLAAVAALPVAAGVTAGAAGWIFTGPVPVTYLQYLGSAGTLTAEPGEFTTAITPASGYAYQLAVPPPDGRWLSPFEGDHPVDLRLRAPLRAVRKQHGQRSRSAYAALGARR